MRCFYADRCINYNRYLRDSYSNIRATVNAIGYNTLLTAPNMVVKGGDYFSILIKAMNPGSTGYTWQLPDSIPDNVEFISSKFIEYEHKEGYVGMPGVYLFTFKAVPFESSYVIELWLKSPTGLKEKTISVPVKIIR